MSIPGFFLALFSGSALSYIPYFFTIWFMLTCLAAQCKVDNVVVENKLWKMH